MARTKQPKEGYIVNPDTGRYVKIGSATYKKIMSQKAPQKPPKEKGKEKYKTVPELKAEAKGKGVVGYNKMIRSELLVALGYVDKKEEKKVNEEEIRVGDTVVGEASNTFYFFLVDSFTATGRMNAFQLKSEEKIETIDERRPDNEIKRNRFAIVKPTNQKVGKKFVFVKPDLNFKRFFPEAIYKDVHHKIIGKYDPEKTYKYFKGWTLLTPMEYGKSFLENHGIYTKADYKKWIKKHHPDRNPNMTEEELNLVQIIISSYKNAYET